MALMEHARDGLELLISPTCAAALTTEGDHFNSVCLKVLLSKLLGLAVVLGAAIVKVPQIAKIVRANSAKGVSLFSHLLELYSYTFTLSYPVSQGNPFSTYGEAAFITLQLVVLVMLISHYNGNTLGAILTLIVYPPILGTLLLGYVDAEWIKLGYASSTVMLVIARVSQIVTILRAGSTGELAFITSFLNTIGSAARVFTTIQEVDDKMILLSFITGVILNTVITLLFVVYWNADAKKAKEVKKNK